MTEETENAEPVQEQESSPVVSQESTPEPSKVDAQAENWKKANEILSQQKRKIEELEMQLQQVAKTPVKKEEEVDEFASLDPEDYLTVSSAKKMAEKYAERVSQKTVREEIQKFAQQQTITVSEEKARSRYEDYDYVVENFAIPLMKSDPALAYKIQSSPNPAETAYKLGKLSDNYEESTVKQQTSQRAEKIMKNNSRPVSSAAVGSSLKSQADQFSKMSKAEIWSMSEKFARGA